MKDCESLFTVPLEPVNPEGEEKRPSLVDGLRQPGRPAWAVAFSIAWFAAQIGLIGTATRRADGAFGFRMFSESTTVSMKLTRELDGGARVPVSGGAWVAKDSSGVPHRLSWLDRVKRADLSTFDRETHASYGEDAQLERLNAALDDVASHIPEDAETRRLLLDVKVWKNGREPHMVTLASAPR